jgi:hypothetical protein
MADAEKDRLLKGLKEVASQGQETAKNAKQVAKDACFLSEIAKNLESVVKEIPDGSLTPEQWKYHAFPVTLVNDQMKNLQLSEETTKSFTLATSTVANTAATLISAGGINLTPASQRYISEIEQLLGIPDLVDEVCNEFQRLGIASYKATEKTPKEQLNDAHHQLKLGGGQATAVLISLRGCIDDTVADLLRRCPGQQNTTQAGGKVTSILGRCGQPGLDPGLGPHLNQEYKDVGNILSRQGKTGKLTDDEIRGCFRRSLTLLKSLLGSVDEKRLLPPPS